MNQTADVVVVGGGVIGCFIAYELSKAGLEVVVIEKGQVGAEASSAAAGLLVPLHMAEDERALFELHLASTQMFPTFVPELEAETGISVEYIPSGILRVALNEEEETDRLSQFQKLGELLGWQQHDWMQRNYTLLSLHWHRQFVVVSFPMMRRISTMVAWFLRWLGVLLSTMPDSMKGVLRPV